MNKSWRYRTYCDFESMYKAVVVYIYIYCKSRAAANFGDPVPRVDVAIDMAKETGPGRCNLYFRWGTQGILSQI